MARKSIPISDKKEVIERVVRGQSLRQAIKGTSISSHHTAQRLVESADIAQMRAEYLQLIEDEYEGHRTMRAKALVDMLSAMKVHGKSTRSENMVPDYKVRLEAIKYIDELSGMRSDQSTSYPAQITPLIVLDNHRMDLSLPKPK